MFFSDNAKWKQEENGSSPHTHCICSSCILNTRAQTELIELSVKYIIMLRILPQFAFQSTYYTEQNLYPSPLVRPCQGGSHVAHLNFKTSCVSVYKCLSLIVGFALTVPICWPREVVSCHDFILHTVATFWAMSLVGIYPGRASLV